MVKRSIRSIFLSMLMAIAITPIQAWWDAGHKTVAEIAYGDLTPEAKKAVDQIVEQFHKSHPSYETFADLSTWPDHLQEEEKKFLYSAPHFITLAYDPEEVLTPKEKAALENDSKESGSLVYLEKAKAVLANKDASVFSKCWALSYLSHVVADLHQPMHCCTRYSKELPQGDRGGNLHPIIPIKNSKASNLHLLWDSGVGFLPVLSGDKGLDAKKLQIFAERVKEDLPKEKLPASRSMNPNEWTLESHKIAVDHAHTLKIGRAPTPMYIEKSKKIVEERIALAGYRLSSVLNEVFSSKEPKVMKGDE